MCGFISLSQTASVHFTLETAVGFGDGDSERCTVCDTFLCVKESVTSFVIIVHKICLQGEKEK